LLLAASELAAFRAAAQGERDRLGQAVDAAKAQVQAIEATLAERDRAHAAEISQLRDTLERQIGQREQAWSQFSEGLRERITKLAAAEAQHAHDVEEQTSLRRQLHDAREKVESTEHTRAELEKRLSASEEAFALAAAELQKVRDDVVLLTEQCAEVSRELSATAALCAQLQVERRLVDTKLSEADTQRTRMEDELSAMATQLRDLRIEREDLLTKAQDLRVLTEKHSELGAESSLKSQAIESQQKRIEELMNTERNHEALKKEHAELEAQSEDQLRKLQTQDKQLEELARASQELEALRRLFVEVERRVEGMSEELVNERSRAYDLERTREQAAELKLEISRLERERDELRQDYTQADTARRVLEPVREEAARLRDVCTKLEAQLTETRMHLDVANQSSSDATADKDAAEWQLQEARKLEEAARARVRGAEADVIAAHRERDQVRASVEVRQTEINELEQRLASQRAELDELMQSRWGALDSEKQRSVKLRAELDQARAEIARLRGVQGGATLPPQLQHAPAGTASAPLPSQTATPPPATQLGAAIAREMSHHHSARDAEELSDETLADEPRSSTSSVRNSERPRMSADAAEVDELEELDPAEIEEEVRERLDSLGPTPARSIEAGIEGMLNADPARTLPPRQPANDVQPPKQRRRRGETAYSVNQVEEEDVYGTGRMARPGRSEGGGRGGR
jgi:chromosome segregation ATPase